MKDIHKKYILENLGKRPVKDIAIELGLKEEEVRKFLNREKNRPKKTEAAGISIINPAEIHGRLPIPAAIIIIFLIGCATYFNSFHNQFVFDDEFHVVKNTAIKSFKNIPQVFKHNLTHFGGEEGDLFRPVETITFMANYALGELRTTGYHITNTFLHILVCVIFFCVTFFVIKSVILSLMISLIYLVHPVHTEAVTYISGRADSLAMIFLLLMVLFQRKYWEADNNYKRIMCYGVILISFSLALLSKEIAVFFPFLLIFCEYCLRERNSYTALKGRNIIFYIPFFILASVWFFLKNQIVPTKSVIERLSSLGIRMIAAPKMVFDYLKISILPFNLHMEYRIPYPRLSQSAYFGPFLFLIFFLIFFAYVWNKGKKNINYRVMFFGLGWFMLALFPYLNIAFSLNGAFAEHWLYIPEAGFIIFAVYSLFYYTGKNVGMKKFLIPRTNPRVSTRGWRGWLFKGGGSLGLQSKGAPLFLCFLIIMSYSYLTIRQNTVWKDPVTFYTYTLALSPNSEKVCNNLAVKYIELGRLSEARELLKRAVKIDPEYEEAMRNLRTLDHVLESKSPAKQ